MLSFSPIVLRIRTVISISTYLTKSKSSRKPWQWQTAHACHFLWKTLKKFESAQTEFGHTKLQLFASLCVCGCLILTLRNKTVIDLVIVNLTENWAIQRAVVHAGFYAQEPACCDNVMILSRESDLGVHKREHVGSGKAVSFVYTYISKTINLCVQNMIRMSAI